MHFAVALLLLVLWIVGWLTFKVLGAAIHLLVILAVVAFIMGLVHKAKTRRR